MEIVLLEHPRIESALHYHDVANAPLYACLITGYIASVLMEHGFRVSIYDAYLAGHGFEEAERRLCSIPCDLLGVHTVFFWEKTPELFSFLERMKACRPNVFVVLYGIFPTFAWRELLERYHFIDGIVIGEPEMTFLDVAQCIASGRELSKKGIPGFAVRQKGMIRAPEMRPPVEVIDVLPFPVRHQELVHAVGGSILGSRGCSGACSFCCINPFYGRPRNWRGRTPENIEREIRLLLPHLKERYIYFLDADFFGDPVNGKRRSRSIARMLEPYRVRFGLEARPIDIDSETVAHLAAAGLQDLFLGIESGSGASLRRMRKAGTVEASRNALRILREFGVNVTPGFIMFEPNSTLDDVRENFSFLKQERLLERLPVTAHVLYHREICLAGMPGFARYRAESFFVGYDFFGYEGYYRFKDPRVQIIADLMSQVCRAVLKMTDTPGSPLWRGTECSVSERMNRYLIELFQECLDRLVRGDMLLREDVTAMLIDQTMGEIAGMCNAVA